MLGDILAGKGIIRAGYGSKGKGIIRADCGSEGSSFLKKFLIPPHALTNSETQKYYQNEPRFNGDYSRDNSPNKIKDGAYVINLDEHSDIRMYWVALCILNNKDTYLDIFKVLELNIFQKTFKNSLKGLQSRQIFLEDKHMIL